jgi:ABC-2 type transport system permease protein
MSRIKHLVIKEFIQTFRDPRMKAVIFVVPIVQSLIFGYAVTTDVKNVAIAVFDRDNSAESRRLVSHFSSSHYFHIRESGISHNRTKYLMDHGKVKAVLEINHGFGKLISGGKDAAVQMILDGSDSNTAGIILGYAGGIIKNFNKEILRERSGTAALHSSVELRSRGWFNENLESRNFYVPGVIALLVMLVTLMLSSMAIVREKEIGTIEQIIVTPVKQYEFILGKTVPFALIGFIDVALISIICVYWFEIPIRGSLVLLMFCTALYLMNTLGIGLLISTVSTTQQQAMMSAFFVFLPCILLSGFIFPIANMPETIQWLTYLNPLRYFLVIVRGIFLKGIGAEILWPQMGALAALGSVLLVLASQRFRKTVA